MHSLTLTPVADIRTDYAEKFGVPRQPGLSPSARGRIVFRPGFANPDMLRGLDEFSHLWIIFRFHLAKGWNPTVRPPRLGGNTRLGVFASRSPFRPNPLGLSVVRLERVERDAPGGPVLHVVGADLVDNTPIFDIKPYVAYADSIPNAVSGFAFAAPEALLRVEFAPGVEAELAAREARLPSLVRETLAQDPRPAFHDEPDRVYGVTLAGLNVRFRIEGDRCEVLGAIPEGR